MSSKAATALRSYELPVPDWFDESLAGTPRRVPYEELLVRGAEWRVKHNLEPRRLDSYKIAFIGIDPQDTFVHDGYLCSVDVKKPLDVCLSRLRDGNEAICSSQRARHDHPRRPPLPAREPLGVIVDRQIMHRDYSLASIAQRQRVCQTVQYVQLLCLHRPRDRNLGAIERDQPAWGGQSYHACTEVCQTPHLRIIPHKHHQIMLTHLRQHCQSTHQLTGVPRYPRPLPGQSHVSGIETDPHREVRG